MRVDELRMRMRELMSEFSQSRKIRRQLEEDILALDDIMSRNFDAVWNLDKQCYEQ